MAIFFNQTGQILTPVWDKTKVNIDWPSSLANWCRTLWVQVPQDQVSPHLHSPQQGYQSGQASLSRPGSHTSSQFSYQVPPWRECPSISNGKRRHLSPPLPVYYAQTYPPKHQSFGILGPSFPSVSAPYISGDKSTKNRWRKYLFMVTPWKAGTFSCTLKSYTLWGPQS